MSEEFDTLDEISGLFETEHSVKNARKSRAVTRNIQTALENGRKKSRVNAVFRGLRASNSRKANRKAIGL